MIEFANSDSTIWNREQLIIDLAMAMHGRQPRIDVGTHGEGPCARSLGLYNLLDNMCQRFQYPPHQIYITTCNLAEWHDVYNIIVDPQMLYLVTAQRYNSIDSSKQITKHFGHFIGHGNYPRLYLGSHLYQHHAHRTTQTYHCSVTNSYHRPFIGLEDMMFFNDSWSKVRGAVDLLTAAPLTIDSIDKYPILNPTTLNITKVYPEFFVEVVNLTYWSGDTFYIDEKIWRPILMHTPFVVHGPQKFLSRLRALGFRTFDHWWDEGYSEDPPDHQLKEIVHLIDHIGSWSTAQLQNAYTDMQPVLEHNYQLMKKIQKHNLHV
jgi:hypothetical protein